MATKHIGRCLHFDDLPTNVYQIIFADNARYTGITCKDVKRRLQEHWSFALEWRGNCKRSELNRRLLAFEPHQIKIVRRCQNRFHAYALERKLIAECPAHLRLNVQQGRQHGGRQPVRAGTYRCSVCRRALPDSCYTVDGSRYNGLSSRCCDCPRFLSHSAGEERRQKKAEARAHKHLTPGAAPAERRFAVRL